VTTLSNRPNTAVLVIDVQNGVVANGHDRDAVVSNINDVVAKARAAQVPVVWIQHDSEDLPKGSDTWQIVPELVPNQDEAKVEKQYGDSFEATNLDRVLGELGVGSLVITGAQTDACVRSTLHGAVARGYDALLVGDAHTTDDLSEYGAPTADKVIAHTNLYWKFQEAPGRTMGVVTADEIAFGINE
jgi:nicotinamidase-related amidase